MSDTKQNDIIELLREYPAGRIYTVAPKPYVLRGFDYYNQGRLLQLEWNDDSSLTAKVKGTRFYSVDFSVNGHGLAYSCDCPAWSPSSNCKHVVCSLITLKNLLKPDEFNLRNQDEPYKKRLMEELNYTPGIEEKKVSKQGYAIVMEKDEYISDLYLALDGRRLQKFNYTIPRELRYLLPAYYYAVFDKYPDFAAYLRTHGNKYPFIIKTDSDETEIRFNDKDEYTRRSGFDAFPGSVTISKLCLRNGRAIDFSIIEDDYVLDIAQKSFGMIDGKGGWGIWREFRNAFSDNDGYDDYPGESPGPEQTSIELPLELFQSATITFPSSEGTKPEGLILKVRGRKASPLNVEPTHRLMITSSGKDDGFILRAECFFTGMDLSSFTSQKLFSFLTLLNRGVNPQLRAKKRKIALYEAFFDMLSENSRSKAENVIRQCVSDVEFNRYKTKKAARGLLNEYLSIFLLDEKRLMLHNSAWISAHFNKKKELQLYKIPYEIFGWRIFDDMRGHNEMTVPAKDLHENLPLLYERLRAEGIDLFFDNKPFKTSTWDFSFDARRASGIDWFEIRPEIKCDGKIIDQSLLADILSKGTIEKDGCIRIMDSNSKKIFDAISTIYKAGGSSKDIRKEIVRVPKLQILDWIGLRNSGVKVKLSREDERIIERLTTFEKIGPRPLPEKLKAKLRQYQKDGYSWLSFLYEHRFGACLADDMGLGKTLQAICLLAAIKERKTVYPSKEKGLPHLIVLPPSLLFNWEHEIKKFYKDLKIMYYTGKERHTSFDGYDCVLTTYGLVRRDIDKLMDISFDVIIFDEAQAVKNIYADTTGAVRRLRARFKLAMTGTPVENHIGEYYSIVDLTIPGLLGDFEKFKPMIKHDISPSLDLIIKRTRPFVLRRTKDKVLKELPPKVETDIYLDLTEKQKALYKKTVERIKSTIDTAYRTKTVAQAQIIALTAILKLRQLCVSPQLLSPETKGQSPKIDFLIERLKELLNENHSALIFSQFTSFLDIVQEDLKKHGMEFLRLDGSTRVSKRKQLIEKFQTEEGPSIFLLSLKAGGQGLNLTKASYVFHLDPWWNPAVENQASDRAHRIGQKNKVTIIRLLMRHTIEEKMMTLKKKKLQLYKAVMDDSSRTKKGPAISRSDLDFLLK